MKVMAAPHIAWVLEPSFPSLPLWKEQGLANWAPGSGLREEPPLSLSQWLFPPWNCQVSFRLAAEIKGEKSRGRKAIVRAAVVRGLEPSFSSGKRARLGKPTPGPAPCGEQQLPLSQQLPPPPQVQPIRKKPSSPWPTHLCSGEAGNQRCSGSASVVVRCFWGVGGRGNSQRGIAPPCTPAVMAMCGFIIRNVQPLIFLIYLCNQKD